MFKKSVFLTVLILVIIILTGCNQQEEVYIERVIDGDTIKTAAGDSIRLIGVDTPEIDWENNDSEFYAQKARLFTEKMLLNKNIALEYDSEKEDHYGRILAYVFYEGENFNEILIEKGYASLMIVEPNSKYELDFKKAAAEARSQNLGVWSQVLEAEKNLPVITYQEAENFIGKEVVVRGKIVNTAAAESVSYLNFSENYRNTLSIVIFKNNLNKFDYQPTEYILNKEIKVLGKVKLYKGSPQIIVDDPYDILIIK